MKNNKYKIMRTGDIKFILDDSLVKYGVNFEKNFLDASIKNFYDVLSQKCSNFDFNLFLENFKKTRFNIKTLIHEEDNISKLKIKYGKINKIRANTTLNVYRGLMNISSHANKDYGNYTALMDSYGQLLINRYFGEDLTDTCFVYIDEVMLIEEILGKDYVEEKFFQGNYDEAINKLSEYSSKNKIDALIFYTKYLSELKVSSRKDRIEQIELLDNISRIIHTCMNNKMKLSKKNKEKGINR